MHIKPGADVAQVPAVLPHHVHALLPLFGLRCGWVHFAEKSRGKEAQQLHRTDALPPSFSNSVGDSSRPAENINTVFVSGPYSSNEW